MKIKKAPLLFIAIVLLFLWLLNPGENRHFQKINEKIQPVNDPHEQRTDVAYQMGIKYCNYIFFSLTCIQTGEKTNKHNETVSLGIGGMVFVFKDFGILGTPQIF